MTLVTALSSVGNSPAIVCDPTKRTTTVMLQVSTGSCGTFGVQYTLDDPTVLQYASPGGSSATTWAALSTSTVIVSSTALEPLLVLASPIRSRHCNLCLVKDGNG